MKKKTTEKKQPRNKMKIKTYTQLLFMNYNAI